jgi:hypothetical protein
MSATEKDQPTCLPPEAYIRIIRNCDNNVPKFRSSVYPNKNVKSIPFKKNENLRNP